MLAWFICKVFVCSVFERVREGVGLVQFSCTRVGQEISTRSWQCTAIMGYWQTSRVCIQSRRFRGVRTWRLVRATHFVRGSDQLNESVRRVNECLWNCWNQSICHRSWFLVTDNCVNARPGVAHLSIFFGLDYTLSPSPVKPQNPPPQLLNASLRSTRNVRNPSIQLRPWAALWAPASFRTPTCRKFQQHLQDGPPAHHTTSADGGLRQYDC